jgi:hypothetical protein
VRRAIETRSPPNRKRPTRKVAAMIFADMMMTRDDFEEFLITAAYRRLD